MGDRSTQHCSLTMSLGSIRSSVCFALALISLARSAQSGESFRLITEPRRISERGEVTSYVLILGGDRYSFLPPPDWKVQGNAAQNEVVMMSPDRVASIRFKIVSRDSDSLAASESEKFRAQIFQRYPNAKILAEFPCYTADAQGTAFDLEEALPNKSKVSHRLAFLPLSGKSLEFDLSVTTAKFGLFDFTFSNLLTSFHTRSRVSKG